MPSQALNTGESNNISMIDQRSAVDNRTDLPSAIANCQCDDRVLDEEEKENMMAEIHLTYEEILQLE